MKRWAYAGVALALVAALLLAAFPESAVAQQTRTRIAYLLTDQLYVGPGGAVVSGDMDISGDVAIAGSISADDFLAIAADSLSIADDAAIGGHLTSLGAPMTVITATKTITPTAEAVYLIASGGAAATVTVDPAQLANGARVTFVSLEATAHKVVAPTIGFNKADAAGDTCTWSTAIGNSLEVVFYEGEWYVLNQTNCTMG
jgi:plastocyanin